MKKSFNFILIIFFLFLLTSEFFLIKKITSYFIKDYSFTKAVCNSTNYCEDKIITYKGNSIKIISTGNAVQFSDNWKDFRK